jgi:phosphoribosyl 1,2-cyclic phosphodiesterase
MGKTFREGVLRHFENYNITSIDSIIITHAHCDAYGGLDDVRDVTDRIPGYYIII